MMHVSPTEVSIVIVSAVGGCLATSAAFNAIRGKPASIIAGNWRKHIWSIMFALPAIMIFHLNVPLALILLILLSWLVLAPSIAAKYIFGSIDAEWSFLFMLHSAYGFTVVTLILLLSRLFLVV